MRWRRMVVAAAVGGKGGDDDSGGGGGFMVAVRMPRLYCAVGTRGPMHEEV